MRRTKRGTPPSTRSPSSTAGRRIIICAFLAGVLVAPGQGSNDPSPALADVRPNIVVVITDDQRADQLARMAVTTSELAGNGVRFDQAFASHPLCCPARATILRGQYAHTTGIYSNEGNRGGWTVFRDRGLEKSTLATWLHGTGYRTGLVGKYLNGYDAATNYVPPGWDFWRGGAPAYYNRGGAPTYASNLLTRYADEFVRGTPANTPLFLYLSYLVPHEPSKPAPQYATDPRCNGISMSGVPSFQRGRRERQAEPREDEAPDDSCPADLHRDDAPDQPMPGPALGR